MLRFFFGILIGVAVAGSVFGSETVKGAKEDLRHFKQEMSAKLTEVENHIQELKVKTQNSSEKKVSEVTEEYEKTKAKLQAQLKDLKEDGEHSWKKFKGDLSSSINSLNDKVQSALKE